MYPERLFTDDMLTIIEKTQNERKEEIKEFQDGNKKPFLEKIKKENADDIFVNFNPLIAKIKELLA